MICEELTTVTFVAAFDPNSTAVAPFRFVPVIVTAVPPEVGPEDGLTPVTDGGCGPPLPMLYWPEATGVGSEVVWADSVSVAELAGLVTPPSCTVSIVLLPTVSLLKNVQVAVRLFWLSEQSPMLVLLAVRISELLTLLRTVPVGKVIVIALFASVANAPVGDVVNEMAYVTPAAPGAELLRATAGDEIAFFATTGKLPLTEVGSELVCTERVFDPVLVVFVTPPSWIVSGEPAPTVSLLKKVQVAVRLFWLSEQSPMLVLLAVRISELLTLLRTVPVGKVIVTVLLASVDIAPVEDVVKPIE